MKHDSATRVACTRSPTLEESATAAPRHAAPCTLCTHVRACPGLRVQGEGEGGSGGRLGAMLICMRRHDGRHRSSGGCATLGAEGSEGKHRSLSPVHPPRPLPLLPAAPRPSTPRVIRTFYLPSLSRPPPSPAPPSSAIFLASFSLSVTVLSFPPAPASPFFPFPRRPTSATRRRLKPENNEPSSRLFLSPVSIAVPSSPSFFLERSAPRISAHFHSFHSQLVFSEASISFVRLDRRAGERRGEGRFPWELRG